MSSAKQERRARFREAVFRRDGSRCRVCGQTGQDAHHITSRDIMPNGGYVPENGITLCGNCHLLAEETYNTSVKTPGFTVDELYGLIGSSLAKAREASKRLVHL